MARIINTANPGKLRNQARRTIAEMLRHLMTKGTLDDEARDMAAMLVYLLREIKQTVDESAAAWEKRGYWMKVERFVRDYEWIPELAANIGDVIRHGAWDLLPELLADLLSRSKVDEHPGRSCVVLRRRYPHDLPRIGGPPPVGVSEGGPVVKHAQAPRAGSQRCAPAPLCLRSVPEARPVGVGGVRPTRDRGCEASALVDVGRAILEAAVDEQVVRERPRGETEAREYRSQHSEQQPAESPEHGKFVLLELRRDGGRRHRL